MTTQIYNFLTIFFIPIEYQRVIHTTKSPLRLCEVIVMKLPKIGFKGRSQNAKAEIAEIINDELRKH